MAVPPVGPTPALVFSGEGHVRSADTTDAAAVVLGHEAGNLLNFQAIAAARGGYLRNAEYYVRLGFVDGRLTVVGGTSTAVIVAPDPYAIPHPTAAATVTQSSATPAPVQQSGLQNNVDLQSATPAQPVETSFPANATLPAPAPETSDYQTSGATLESTDVSANLTLAPFLTPQVVQDSVVLSDTREALAIANAQDETQSAYAFASNIFTERANFQYEPFAGLGRDPLRPFSPTEIPRLFVDGAY